MKATADQLGKVDFNKWNSAAWKAKLQHGKVYLELSNSMVATRCPVGGWQLFVGTEAVARETLAQIDRCDAFITSELAAIELAERREEAKRAMPEPGEGYELIDEFTARKCHDAEFDFCPFGSKMKGQWDSIVNCGFIDQRHYAFRRPIAKPEPKLPSVKAPDGWEWKSNDLYGVHLCKYENHVLSIREAPKSKSSRDAMAACVAAYDEANSIGTVAVDSDGGMTITGVVLRNGESLQLRTVYT